MALHYILDGYNIIKCVDDMADRSLEQGRKVLLGILRQGRPQGSSRNNVTVVFDGKDDVWGNPSAEAARVIFTSGETADEYIKRAIEDAADRKNMIVVTNDKGITTYVKKLGAQTLSVYEFLAKGKGRALSSKTIVAKKDAQEKGKQISQTMEYRINKEFEKIWLKDNE